MVETKDGEFRTKGVQVFNDGALVNRETAKAGNIAVLSGLPSIRIGDHIGKLPKDRATTHFAPPSLETRVFADNPSKSADLWSALSEMADQDPLINLRKNDEEQSIFVSLYGEVQKEVIQHMLDADYATKASFSQSSVICVERPKTTGQAVEEVMKNGNPFYAGVGVRVDPKPAGSGVSIQTEADIGQMPKSFYRAIEETLVDVMKQGAHGWPITDCLVSITYTDFVAPVSVAGDFRAVTPLALANAMMEAGLEVCEPIHQFELQLPTSMIGNIMPVLSQSAANIKQTIQNGDVTTMSGEIAAANLHALQTQIPSLTGGEGVLDCSFSHHQSVSGDAPSRTRVGPTPFNREAYLNHLLAKKGNSS